MNTPRVSCDRQQPQLVLCSALLCAAVTTVRSPRPLSLPLRSLLSTERPRLTLWLGCTQTHLSPPGRAAGTTRSDSPLCPRSEAFNPVQMECMAFKATKRNDGREEGREWLAQLTRWMRALASRQTCFWWLFWGLPLCYGCGAVLRSISQRQGGRGRGGAVSHWTLSHFWLWELPAWCISWHFWAAGGLEERARATARARFFCVRLTAAVSLPTPSPSSSASSALQTTMVPFSSTCGSLGAFFFVSNTLYMFHQGTPSTKYSRSETKRSAALVIFADFPFHTAGCTLE